jgi:hypothetical protein
MRVHSSMRAGAACACFLVLSLTPARAMVRNTLAQRNCPTALLLDRAVSNATLYRQVYEWAHNKDVSDWRYEVSVADDAFVRAFELSADDVAGLECATVHYTTTVSLPDGFAAFMRFWNLATDVPLTVDKQVCRTEHAILERAVVHEPVVREIHMSTRHEVVSAWDVRSSSHMELDLPWYAQLLETQIGDALDRSVREKGDAVMHSLCAAPLFPALLRLHRPNASFVAQAVAAPARRKFSLRRTEPRFDAEPRWHEYL